MNKFFRKVRCKRYRWVVNECDVTTALAAIDNYSNRWLNSELVVGRCGWVNESNKWFVFFNASDAQWMNIVGDLNKAGFELVVSRTYDPNYQFLTKIES